MSILDGKELTQSPPWPDAYIHEVNGKWRFEDETGAYDEREFNTREEAVAAIEAYARQLNREDSNDRC